MNMSTGSNNTLNELDVRKAISTLSDKAQFPYIPSTLSKYVETCISKGRSNRLVEAVIGKKINVFTNINRMFELACETTCLSSDELLKKTDFHSSDIFSTRLDSAFAEIRTVNFLKKEGFRNIQLLDSRSKKRADIIGMFCGKLFAIEVANSIFSADGRVEPVQLKDWLVGRVISDRKSAQLEKTTQSENANETVLVGVIDTLFSVVYNTHNDYCDAAELAWEELGGKANFRVAFVTGKEAVGYGRDDCVFPSWPGV
jgi:hypothetical protein